MDIMKDQLSEETIRTNASEIAVPADCSFTEKEGAVEQAAAMAEPTVDEHSNREGELSGSVPAPEAPEAEVTSSDVVPNSTEGETPIVEEKQEKEEEIQQNPAEEDEDVEAVLPPLPLPDPISDFRGSISAFGFSQQGESHIHKEAPCQDRSSLRFISDSVVISAVADGVGSCALSDYGSATAVEASLSYLEEHLGSKLEDPSFQMDIQFMGKVLREMMQYAYDQVKLKAEQMQQLLYSLQSTLTVAVYDGETLYFAHAGDDGIVALTHDGQCAMVTSRHKGEEASSVYPLQSRKTWQYGKVDHVVGFVMATDGVLDAFVRNEVEGNRIYYPFIEPAFSMALSGKEETASACNDWYSYMKTPQYRASVTDDLSFVCVANQDALKSAKKYDFDMNEWNKKSQEFAERRKAALYPPKSQLNAVKNDPPKTDPQAASSARSAQRPATPDRSNAYTRSSAPQQPRSKPNHGSSNGNYGHPKPAQQTAPVRPNAYYPDDRATREKVRQYGKKALTGVGDALEGMGSLLLVGTEMLLDASEEAFRVMMEYADHSAEARNQPRKPSKPNHPPKDKRNGGGRNGR